MDIKNQIDARYNLAYHLRGEQTLRYPNSWAYTDTKALKVWADERTNIAKQEITDYFNLDKNAHAIKITATSNLSQGKITLNGIRNDSIYADENTVICNTKKGYPITFSAVAEEGYEFKCFDIDGVLWHKNKYTTMPGGNMNIKAVFAKKQ